MNVVWYENSSGRIVSNRYSFMVTDFNAFIAKLSFNMLVSYYKLEEPEILHFIKGSLYSIDTQKGLVTVDLVEELSFESTVLTNLSFD